MGGVVIVLALLAFQVLWANSSGAIDENYKFLECMGICKKRYRSTAKTSKEYVDTRSSSPSHKYLLESSQQNPRWINSTTQNQKPLFIIPPYTESQVQTSVFCSRENDLQIRVQSGGHDYEGQSYRCKTPFVLIDLVNLGSITINIKEETVWVQSGATLEELYYAIAQKSNNTHGFPAGTCPTVGVGGHFSGGGFGIMMRKHGLAADNVIDARVIDVNGRRLLDREKMGEDLFWAIRGGGGSSFGITVSWKIKLVRVPPAVTVFKITKDLIKEEEGTIMELVDRWQHITDKLPRELFIRSIIQKIEKAREVIFDSMFLGSSNELIGVVNKNFPELGLLAEDCHEMTWIESVSFTAGFPRTRQPDMDVLLNRTSAAALSKRSFFKAKSYFVEEAIRK